MMKTTKATKISFEGHLNEKLGKVFIKKFDDEHCYYNKDGVHVATWQKGVAYMFDCGFEGL